MEGKGTYEGGSKIKIVILQRGWVMIGRFSQTGAQCVIDDANVIRRWGTSKGLGELASKGPLTNTVLDPTPQVKFHELTVVQVIDCEDDKWNDKLR
jgi:hypothetical protein